MEVEFYQILTNLGAKPEEAKNAVNTLHYEIEKAVSLKTADYVKRNDLSDFATKSDIEVVKSDIDVVRSNIDVVRSNIDATKNELYAVIEKLKTTMIQWFLGSSISIAAVVIAVIKLWH